jgi:hypothetical protein
MKVGDKLKCIKSVDNVFGSNLFIKDVIYEVLHIDGAFIMLDHILYANEYNEWNLLFVTEHFINIKEERKQKLNSINNENKN